MLQIGHYINVWHVGREMIIIYEFYFRIVKGAKYRQRIYNKKGALSLIVLRTAVLPTWLCAISLTLSPTIPHSKPPLAVPQTPQEHSCLADSHFFPLLGMIFPFIGIAQLAPFFQDLCSNVTFSYSPFLTIWFKYLSTPSLSIPPIQSFLCHLSPPETLPICLFSASPL